MAFSTTAPESLFGANKLIDKLNSINAYTNTQMNTFVSTLDAGQELSSQDLLSIQTKLQSLTVAMEAESSMIKAVGDLLKSIVSKAG